MIIYLVTNKINGKQYVGKTSKTLLERKNAHIYEADSGSKCALHRAIRKWGINNFSWQIIEKCTSEDHMNKAEILHIDLLSTYVQGYNMTRGGEGKLGWKPSEDTKDTWSNQRRGTNQYTRGYIHPSNPSLWSEERREQEKIKIEERKKEANRKRSISLKGRKTWNSGKKMGRQTDEHTDLIQKKRRLSGYVWTIEVISASTMNKVGVYYSQSECCKKLNLDPKKVRKVIGTESQYKGYYFRKLNTNEN
jgi:group I intron endonuclease